MQTVRGIGYRLVSTTRSRSSIAQQRAQPAARRGCVRSAEWYDAIRRCAAFTNRFARIRDAGAVSRWLNSVMPKGLYARALLIIIAADGDPAIGGRLRFHGAALERR